MIDVVMPQMGESIVEGTLTKWRKKTGERVERDEPLFEISTDKVDTEIPSPAAGVLAEVLVEEGQTVPVKSVVARIREEGAQEPAEKHAAEPPAPGTPPPAAGPAAEGIVTTMHYSDTLESPRNKAFRLAYAKKFRLQPDVYAVQGYDTGLLLLQGAAAVKGDLSNKKALYAALESANIDSPRGKWTMSRQHNPVQDMYLRVVEKGENKVIGVAAKALADPGTGCRLA